MKLKQILLACSILIILALLAVFIYDLYWSLDSTVNITSNNVIFNSNNQMSVRDIPTNLSSNNSALPSPTDTPNNPCTTATVTIAGFFCVTLIIATIYSILVFHNILPHPCPTPSPAEAIIMAGAEEFLNQ